MSDSVLIVDDEPSILLSLKRCLRRDGYTIHTAGNGPEALEILKQTEIAVIICDQRMPEMPGAQVLAEAYKLSPDTVRITLTGFTDLNAVQSSINEGHVNHFLLKPWDDAHLRAVVAESVRGYGLIKDNHRLQALTRRQKEELEQWNQQLEEQVRERTEELRAQNERLRLLQHRVEQSLRDTVSVLAGVLETVSPNLGIHSDRVARIARHLANQLDLDEAEARDIEFAAHLHDLGKLAGLVTGKPSPRHRGGSGADPGREDHPETGYAILHKVSGFESVALGVRHQSERFDGTGLPAGLEGENIPLASRIIAVADAYDRTVYHVNDPLNVSHEAGRKLLIREKGRRFDPQVVDLFLKCMDQIGSDEDIDDEVEMSPMKIREGMTLARPIHNHEGILLLKEGTCLTPDLIEHIRSLSNVDPLLTRVFIRCGGEDASPRNREEPQQDATPSMTPPPGIVRTDPDAPVPVMPDSNHADANRSPDPVTSGSGASASIPHQTAMPRTEAVSGTDHPEDPKPDRDPQPIKTVRADSEAGSRGKTRWKVLLVDDSVLICNALRRELRPHAIETVATDSGWTALSMIENDRFDLALVDLMMPAMPGEELLKRLLERAPALPCIILTGNATRETVVTLAQAPNVVGILTKPWDHDRLIATLTRALEPTHPNPVPEPVAQTT